ncbi:hypothetical protein ES703_45842 [subsurface metagenome]
MHEIRPDFQFHQQTDCRANIAEGTAHYPGKIKGEVKHSQVLAEQGICTGKAGIGGGADYDFKIAEFIFKLFDDGSCCVYLAYAYGVQPDTFFCGVSAGDFAESLGPAGPVAFVPDDSVYDDRAVGCRSQ